MLTRNNKSSVLGISSKFLIIKLTEKRRTKYPEVMLVTYVTMARLVDQRNKNIFFKNM